MKTLELVALSVGDSNTRAQILGTGEKVVWRGQSWKHDLVEGEIFRVKPEKGWIFSKTRFICGPVLDSRIDIPALGLKPLKVKPWSNNSFEMEQVIPGADFALPLQDPIVDAVDAWHAGAVDEAYELLENCLLQDLRCIDAHVHLGLFEFGDGDQPFRVRRALKHYTVGVKLGDFFLGPKFRGKLPWGLIDNRPFLRALHGQMISHWALGEISEAISIAKRLLKLNPDDHQGIRFLLPELRQGTPYLESCER